MRNSPSVDYIVNEIRLSCVCDFFAIGFVLVHIAAIIQVVVVSSLSLVESNFKNSAGCGPKSRVCVAPIVGRVEYFFLLIFNARSPHLNLSDIFSVVCLRLGVSSMNNREV